MTSQSEYPSRGSSPELLTRNVEAASRIERITSQEALGIVNEMTEQQEEPEDANVARLFASMSKSMANMKIITAEGSVVQKTLDEYNRQWTSFKAFTVERGFVNDAGILDAPNDIHPDTPIWVAAWIMEFCDDIDLTTLKPKTGDQPRATYAYAQKKRAAISHQYSRVRGRPQPWQVIGETTMGNPMQSYQIAQYMTGLRRRKAKAGGDPVTSARAITADTIKALYDYNNSFNPEGEKLAGRGGKVVRAMLHAIYCISFLCLLRSDEALHIQVHELVPEWDKKRLRLTLPFRKTDQYGEISPFYLYEMKDQKWLCPVRAVATYLTLSGLARQKGYLFRKIRANDRLEMDPNSGLSSDQFLEHFRNNILDLKMDSIMYGTHSFRRGGCQFLHLVLRWPIRDICEWGGWAYSFDNIGTIFKYIISWVDSPTRKREDFFNPNKGITDPCPSCGRTCPCA